MALNLVDRVLETCSAPGTGTVSLLGAVTGYQSFSTVGNGNTCYYTIADQNGANWEVGIGTVTTGSPNTLARTTVLSSSNSGSLVNFATGTQNVFVTYPSEKSVFASNAPGTAGYVLVSGGTGAAATWTAPSSVVGGAAGSNTQVQYNSSGNLAGSANLTFDGTALTLGGNPTLSAGTANGVLYLNGSKVATSGSSFVFDGTNVGIGTSSPSTKLTIAGTDPGTQSRGLAYIYSTSSAAQNKGGQLVFGGSYTGTTETYFAAVAGRKESATDGNYDGYLQFLTRNAGSDMRETMRLDASGNLGLGVTPSAWNGYTALQTLRTSVAGDSGNSAYFSANWYNNAGDKYIANGYATQYVQYSGVHAWKTAPSGTAGNAITFTQAMTLDASGRLMVGTTTPNGNFTVYAASGDNYSTVQSTTNSAYAQYTNTSGSCFIGVDNSTGGAFGGGVAYGRYIYSNGAYPLITVVNGTERMRIDSSGNLLVGTTTATGAITAASVLTTTKQFSMRDNTNNYVRKMGVDASNNWAFYSGDTEQMRLDSSGNVGIGTTTTSNGRLTTAGFTTSAGNADIRVERTGAASTAIGNGSCLQLQNTTSGKGVILQASDDITQFWNNSGSGWNERARIDSSGNLLVGTTTANARLSVNSAGTTSATYVFVGQNSANTNEMTVRSDGAGYLNSAAWVYGSDATIKENIQYLNPKDCLSLLLNAKPVKFDYIEGQKNNFGYVAQDVQEWLPEAVSENPNGKLGLQDGFINTIGTGAIQALNQLIQEQQAIITDLKARITNLENK